MATLAPQYSPVIGAVSVADSGVSFVINEPAEPAVIPDGDLLPVLLVHVTFVSVEISGYKNVLSNTTQHG